MRGRSKAPLAELAVTDGTRSLGRLMPRGTDYEVFDANDQYVCKVATHREGVAALSRADQSKDVAA